MKNLKNSDFENSKEEIINKVKVNRNKRVIMLFLLILIAIGLIIISLATILIENPVKEGIKNLVKNTEEGIGSKGKTNNSSASANSSLNTSNRGSSVSSGGSGGGGAVEQHNSCIPSCAGRQCGDNGCGGSCGNCSSGYECYNGVCNLADLIYPIFLEFGVNSYSIENPGTAIFNATVRNTNGSVFLYINEKNYSTTNITADVYNVPVGLISAGSYNYYWYSYGNGTNKNYNQSSIKSYVLKSKNFMDDFSDNSKIFSMDRLNLNTNITLSSNVNNLNDTKYLLLYSMLGSDNEILNPVIGHAGDPLHHYGFNYAKHYDYDSAMIGWWNFTDNADDSSGNENHGAITGAIHNEEHYDFNGTTDYIKVNYNESLNVTEITVAVWVKINSSKAIHTIIGRGYNNWEISITSNGTGILLYKSNGASSYEVHSSSNAPFGDEDWHYLVWTFNSSDNESIFYIDGSLLDYKTITSNSLYSNKEDLYIGNRLGGVNDLKGSIDEIAIYNRVLSSSEIFVQYRKIAYNVSNINYTFGLIENGSYLNASSELTFSGSDFYAPKGAISFSASLPDWNVYNSPYFFYASDDFGNYIKITKIGNRIFFYFVENKGGYAVISTDDVNSFNDNSWHNFTFAWDINSNFMVYYVDNEHIGYDGRTSGNTYPAYYKGWKNKSDWKNTFYNFKPTRLYIGRGSGIEHELNGTMDEFRILNETYEPTSYSSRRIVLESTAFDTGVLNPVWENISWTEDLPNKTDIEFQISVSDDNSTWTNWAGLAKGLVTLTFDDGYLSQYNNASKSMAPYSYKGVIYVITDLIGLIGFINSTQLLELQSLGWEIGSHSKTHNGWYNIDNLDRSQIINEINGSYQNLTNLGLVQKHFCYPGGFYNPEAIDVLSDYYITARTTEEGYNTYNEKYRLKRKNGADLFSAKTYIDYAADNKVWLILMFHKVGAKGAGSINLDDFNMILSYLNSSNVSVVTIDEALRNLSLYTDSLGEQIKAPSKRYIKYRAMLYSYNGSAPTLDNVKINYLYSCNDSECDSREISTFSPLRIIFDYIGKIYKKVSSFFQ